MPRTVGERRRVGEREVGTRGTDTEESRWGGEGKGGGGEGNREKGIEGGRGERKTEIIQLIRFNPHLVSPIHGCTW